MNSSPAIEEAVDGLELPVAVEAGGRLAGLQPGAHPGRGAARRVRRAGRERLGELGQAVQDAAPLGSHIQAAAIQVDRAEYTPDRRRRRACGVPLGPCGTRSEAGEDRDRNREGTGKDLIAEKNRRAPESAPQRRRVFGSARYDGIGLTSADSRDDKFVIYCNGTGSGCADARIQSKNFTFDLRNPGPAGRVASS
jgi:hypothetical protein